MCKKITDLIKENPRTTLLELEQDTGISKTTIGRIVTKDLKLKKTPAKFIPRFLTNEQKLCRLATCENMLEMTRTDPEWKDKIITGDETWVYDYDPETKRQYAEWRGQGEPRPKKSRILKSRNKCADAFRMLTVAYGEATLDRSNVYRWYKMFSEGREDVNDEERAGCPSTSTTDEKINEVEKMILANRRITVREVAEDLNISIGSCHSIFINDLGMRRVAAKFVPKLLNCDQKQHRMNIANEMLDSVRDDPNLLQRVIAGDEAWVYGYDVETKAQSSQWKLPHEPRPKKARQVRSNVKVLLTVFFDCRGVVHHEFLPQGRTVNKEYYLQVMRNLREAIRQKHPDLWKNKNWLLHHDNAPAHTSLLVRDFLAKNNTLMMPQPPLTRWVPRLLLENHKQQRMEAARAFLEMHQRDGDQLFSRIVPGDEIWVHHLTPETKRQSMVWKKPEESAPKKAKVTISAGKVMAMENFNWEIFTHPPYSPELAPSDFHLYSALKWHLGGKHFANDDEVQVEANHWLRRQDTAWYNSGIKKLLQRYQKCLDRN
ncbi:hypothetical protein LAZ67_16000211, partial [Cordylochernes scorpioides]